MSTARTSGRRQPVKKFTDTKGWYPGIEIRGSSLFYRDVDASVVVPSVGNAPYSTRVVDANGNPLPDFYGLDLGANIVLGTGNPADDGVAIGVSFEVRKVAKNNTYATIRVVPAPAP